MVAMERNYTSYNMPSSEVAILEFSLEPYKFAHTKKYSKCEVKGSI